MKSTAKTKLIYFDLNSFELDHQKEVILQCAPSRHHTEARVMDCNRVTSLFIHVFVMLSCRVRIKPLAHNILPLSRRTK